MTPQHLIRMRALLSRATHPQTPVEEARTSAILLADMLSQYKVLDETAMEPVKKGRRKKTYQDHARAYPGVCPRCGAFYMPWARPI